MNMSKLVSQVAGVIFQYGTFKSLKLPLLNSDCPGKKAIHNRFTALWILFGTTWVSRYQKKHLIRSTTSSLFNLRAWQSFFPQTLSKFSLGLAPSTSYSIHFFTQSLS